MNSNKNKLFAMPNSQKLGEKIAEKLNMDLTPIDRIKYADGESMIVSSETVRSKDVYIIASHCAPVNDNIVELLLFIDSLKRASSKSINVVLTYFGYARQDRKASGRQSIGARLMADMLEKAGVTKVIAVDLHNPSIQGFFSIPLDDLKAIYMLAPKIKELGKFSVASPDHGGAVRARLLAELISKDIQIAIVDKRRTGANKSETMGILGDIKGHNVVIIDDMIDTGGTIIKAAKALKENGAKKVIIAATHGMFSKGFDMFEEAEFIDNVLVTDSIQTVYNIDSKKLKVVSLDAILAETIEATIEATSITKIYDGIKQKL